MDDSNFNIFWKGSQIYVRIRVVENIKLQGDIQKFLDVYKILSPEGKAQFEAQMAAVVKGVDVRTKRLYQSLLSSAREGRGVEEAIQQLQRASREKE